MNRIRLSLLVSGSGSTLQFLEQAIRQQRVAADIVAVFADRPCLALERAALAGLPQQLFSRKSLGKQGLDQALSNAVKGLESLCDVVLLAGYLSVIGPQVLATPLAKAGRIWNIHPSLLPAYGGMGMYGINVHRAVFAAGEVQSGCTLHQVNAEVDGGAILAQRQISVADCPSPQEIGSRIQALEKQLLLEYLQNFRIK